MKPVSGPSTLNVLEKQQLKEAKESASEWKKASAIAMACMLALMFGFFSTLAKEKLTEQEKEQQEIRFHQWVKHDMCLDEK